jgi:hypothetical protein
VCCVCVCVCQRERERERESLLGWLVWPLINLLRHQLAKPTTRRYMSKFINSRGAAMVLPTAIFLPPRSSPNNPQHQTKRLSLSLLKEITPTSYKVRPLKFFCSMVWWQRFICKKSGTRVSQTRFACVLLVTGGGTLVKFDLI